MAGNAFCVSFIKYQTDVTASAVSIPVPSFQLKMGRIMGKADTGQVRNLPTLSGMTLSAIHIQFVSMWGVTLGGGLLGSAQNAEPT